MGDVGAETETESTRSKSFIWWVQAIAVGVYIALLVFAFVYIMKPPSADTVTCLSGYIACLDLNQIGDVFAGVFAPLAFFWLVAAVWLQSQELHDQRKEAADNKVVTAAQAKTAGLQANAAVIQSENATKQTAILQQQIESQLLILKSTAVSSLIEKLHLVIAVRIFNRIAFTNQQGGDVNLSITKGTLFRHGDLYQWSLEFRNFTAANEEDINNKRLKISQADYDSLEKVHGVTSDILAEANNVLPAQRAEIEAIDLVQLHEAVKVLLRCR